MFYENTKFEKEKNAPEFWL